MQLVYLRGDLRKTGSGDGSQGREGSQVKNIIKHVSSVVTGTGAQSCWGLWETVLNTPLGFPTQGVKKRGRGFPGGAVVKNPPANAGHTGSSPWSGKIPHAAEQLSPCATTTEPAL